MAAFAYPGPHCEQVGIFCDTLLSSCKLKLKKLTKGALTKGVLSELNDFRKENDISWDIFHQWIVQLKGEDDINLASLKVSLSRLDKKRAELKRNKEHSKLEELMSKEHFSSSQCHVTECGKFTSDLSAESSRSGSQALELEVLTTVNSELAQELHVAKQQLDDQQTKTDLLTDKLRQLSVRNINKKLSRRDKKLEESQSQLSLLQEEVQEKTDKIVQLEDKLTESHKGAERNRVNLFNANKRLHDLQSDMEQLKLSMTKIESDFDAQSKHLNGKITELSSALDAAYVLLQHCTQVPTNLLTSLNQESLVGRRIRHRWCNPDGTEQWYTCRILSVVPGTTEWFNVQYDGEQEVLSLNLYTDIDNGDLDIIG